MECATSDWEDELGRWLNPFLERLGHKARRSFGRHGCPRAIHSSTAKANRLPHSPSAMLCLRSTSIASSPRLAA